MTRKITLKFFLLFFILSYIIITVPAQDTLLPVTYHGKLDSINSIVLKQKRFIQVFVPSTYKPGTRDTYDVLYVLDGGNWNMSVVNPVQRFLQNEGLMPSTIIVSVMGVDRNIELTPTVLKTWLAPTGGADKFLAYIGDELIPYIDKNYPSNGDNTLWGHSLGGMFTTFAMLKKPTLFKSYIAIDPSLWWDNSYVPKMAADSLETLTDSTITLFISSRDAPSFHEMKIDTMETILKKHAPSNLKWKLVSYPGETHSSIRLKGTYDGLAFTYAGYTSGIEFEPANGIILKDQPYKIVYGDDTSRVHYTLDGTVPTEASAQVNRELIVTGAATVTYKRISNRNRYGKSVTGEFTAEVLPPPVSKIKNAKPGGFRYSYYEGDGSIPANLKTKPITKGILDKNFDASRLPRKNNYALMIEGFLEIKDEGYYTFFARAGKGSNVSINGKLIMHWDDANTRDVRTFLIPLSKGFYPVKIESFDKKEDFKLLLYYITPGMSFPGEPVPIPFDLEYSIDKK